MILKQIKKQFRPERHTGELGYSLVENLVALALFSVVLIPVFEFFGTMMIHNQPYLKNQAAAYAQNAMEQTLYKSSYYNETFEIEEKSWDIIKHVQNDGKLTHIKVSVIQNNTRDTLIIFETERLWPQMKTKLDTPF